MGTSLVLLDDKKQSVISVKVVGDICTNHVCVCVCVCVCVK